jgi:hypothetical protein
MQQEFWEVKVDLTLRLRQRLRLREVFVENSYFIGRNAIE